MEPEENNALVVHDENNALIVHDEIAPDALTSDALALTTPETQPTKKRKMTSMAWDYFDLETVSPGCRRACCKRCKKSFVYSTGPKNKGTGHLLRHITKGTCLALDRDHNNSQSTPIMTRNGGSEPPKRRYRSPASPYVPFDQDHCRHEIAKMIILHDYPLHMVEHPGFLAFVQNLQPRFDKVSFNTVQADCVATYLREKQNVMEFFERIPGRFCITLDMWTSNQTLGYVLITGHFIDSDWKLHQRILNVVMEPYPDSPTAVSHAVAACLSDWNLEGRLFSVTFNHPLTDAGLENLKHLLCTKNHGILNGQLLIGSCVARTFGSMAKEVLAAGQESINKIRDSVKYVKTTDSHEERFMEVKQQLQVPSDKSLSLDNQTQWNTTYQMLAAASEMKEVFSCLDSDHNYKGAPSVKNWKQIEIICSILKPLFEAANILTTTTNPTAITFFHEMWKIHSNLARMNSEDPFIINISKALQEKVDKYWKDCSLVLAVAVVMDPRFKMKLVEFSFSKIYGEEAPPYIKIVEDGIHELFNEYIALPLPLTPTYAEDGDGHMKSEAARGGKNSADNGLTDFDAYIMETSNLHSKSELDLYLEESLLPRVLEFDVLGWWKQHKHKYPTLSKMARDILSIPVSTTTPDSVFDLSNKQLDQYRSSLRPETVEALICAKDWLQYVSMSSMLEQESRSLKHAWEIYYKYT